MTNPFFEVARRGKNEGWRYLAGSVLTLFTFIIPGGLLSSGLLGLYVATDGNPASRLLTDSSEIGPGGLPVEGVGPLPLFIFINLGFFFFVLGVYLSVQWLHERSLLSLITPGDRINWRRIAQGFGVFFGLKVIEIGVNYALSPQEFTLIFEARTFFIFLACVLLLTPVQIAAEELFCRGYLLQGIGLKLGKWPAILSTSLLFAALHSSNPEVAAQSSFEATFSIMGYYFLIGAFLAWLTVKDKTLELALGVHAANNIATFLLVTSPDSVLPSPAVFSIAGIEATFFSLFYTALMLLIFAFIIFRVLKKPVIAPLKR